MDNALKRSFPIHLKEEKEKGCGCGCNDQAQELQEAFDQEEGVTSFLKEQRNPLAEEEEEDMPEPPQMDDEEEEEMEEVSRGAVEDVLAELNDDVQTQERTEDRGAVEDVLRSLNRGGEGYGLGEGEVPDELEDNQFGSEEEEEEEEMDEVVASVLGELNEDEEDPCWDGYTQVGMKTQDGEEVPNCVPDDDVEDAEGYEEQVVREEEDPCWDGYTMVGKKTDENGNEVPNCVPEEDAENYDPDESVQGQDLMDAVLEDQVEELNKLDQLAEQVLNG